MRLIDADSLDSVPWECKADAMNAIRSAPTIDAVPVVRCQECIHYDMPQCQIQVSFHGLRDDDFCSYGERKEGGDNG